MANEISANIRVALTNPTSSTTQAILRAVFDLGAFQLNQTTAAYISDTVTVGTGAEQDIAIPTNSKFTAALQGLLCAVNLDTTNFVKLGPKSGGVMVETMRLYPRFPVVIPVAPSVTMRWIADTASCSVMYVWLAK